ncbi:MAG: GntR family transcriptional regulator [Alphaproteobacteria bacterium]|nr:GntR family transcriptional regulator [Alphaproteobacteria bacterium]
MSQTNDRPIAEHIAATLVERIVAGELKSGERITEQAIADEFGTSRGPVRDALRYLHARNWIQLLPHQGARVSQAGSSIPMEATTVSAVMFGLACRFASLKATDADLQLLSEKVRALLAAAKDKRRNAAEFLHRARDAGNLIVRIAANPQVEEVVGPVPRRAVADFAMRGLTSAEDIKEAVDHWMNLTAAIRMREPDVAEREGRALIEAAYRRVIAAELRDGL